MRTLLRGIGRLLLALIVAGLGAWATLALRVAGSDAGAVRSGLAVGMATLTLAAAIAVLLGRRRGPILLPWVVAVGSVLIWFGSLQPSAGRDWQPDVAQAPWAEIDGDRVTIHNVRNFTWHTESDFTPRWESRTVDLHELTGLDLVASYWMGDAIAHILVSFVFANAPPLTVSIETRKEVGEAYSTLLGFFRRYELVYVVSDERDLIGLRTNVRADPPEDVYLYRTRMPPASAQRLFLEYLRQINELHEHPAFYNTATSNCTTQALINNRVNSDVSLLSWKVLLSGYMPELVYEHGGLATGLPFAELRRRSRINDAARAAGLAAPDFSVRIRAGLPPPGG